MSNISNAIYLAGDSISIVEQLGPSLTDVLLSKFGCEAQFFNIDSAFGPSERPTVVPEKKWSAQLSYGSKISVWKADLTDVKVDAVVNAANHMLSHAGGLALALSMAGGPEINEGSCNYIQRNGPLETGSATITKAGKLPCKWIIHAVGPSVSYSATPDEVNKAAPLLKKAVESILRVADRYHIQTVAIPALSSGLFNFPLPRCADIIVSTLKECYEHPRLNNLPTEIQLVNNDDPSVSEMERACKKILSTASTRSYSQAVSGSGNSTSKTSTLFHQIRNVRLFLQQGKIEEQETDVIVNTASPNLRLNEGQISKAISEKAGNRMQEEIQSKYYSKNVSYGDVLITESHHLKCRSVYHTFCSASGSQNAEQILFGSVEECLERAHRANYKSISFPAIGTGNLRFNKDDVARIMTAAVYSFAKRHQAKMDVYFVIYPTDHITMKAFKMELKMKKRLSDEVSQQHYSSPESQHRKARTERGDAFPLIKLSAQFPDRILEARHWLEDILFNQTNFICVKNNFIQHFGQREFEQLSRKSKAHLSIEEFYNKSTASIMVKAGSPKDRAIVGLEVEKLLCNIQKAYARDEVEAMRKISPHMVNDVQKPVNENSTEYWERERLLRRERLKLVRLVKVENAALKDLFEIKGKQLSANNTDQMFQRIPAQFCNLVSHVGFQREFSPPDDPRFGEGIYLTNSIAEAERLWKDLADEKYCYFVEAKVLVGKSTMGSEGLIVPPTLHHDPLVLYDSVKNSMGSICVIFNGHQALPEYIIVCERL